MTDSNVTVPDLQANVTVVFQTILETVEETVPMGGTSNGVNALGLVVFSMCFGLVIGNMKQQGQALREFFDCLNDAIMRLVAIIIWLVLSIGRSSQCALLNIPTPTDMPVKFMFLSHVDTVLIFHRHVRHYYFD